MSITDDFLADAGVKPPTVKAPSLADQFAADAKAGAIVAPVAQAPPAESGLSQLAHQLGLTARAGITGLASLPNMAGDALNGAINLGTSGINSLVGTHIPQLGLPSRATQNLMDSAGVSQPQNGMERGIQAAASAAAGVNPSLALGKALASTSRHAVQAIGTGMQASPGMQMVGAAGAGSGGSIAAENGAGIGGQLAASLLGGLGGVGAASGAKAIGARMSAPSAQQQLVQALRDQANNAQTETVKPRLKLNVDGTVVDSSQPASAPQPVAVVPAQEAAQFMPPPIPPAGRSLGTQRQLANIDLMKAIGLEDQRPSAISGNKYQAGIEYENAKLNNQLGQVARDQLAKEQGALKGYAQKIIADTGATSAAPEAAGQAIRAPMQGLSDHFDTEIGKLYDVAKTNAGEMGAVNPKNLNSLIGDHDFRESLLSSPAGTTLLGSIERQVKRFQGIPVPGEELPPAPNTVNSAENLRKWMNAQWSPGNSRLIGKVKEALDSDVANAGGSGVFDRARALHGLRRDMLDNPNGISKLLTVDGPNGINQAIPDEQVAPKLLTMPTGQFAHVVKTLQALPGDLAEHGQRAIAEIQGALARKIYAAGDTGGTQNGASVWNAANVTRELNAQRSKMAILFAPEQLKSFETLHDAGHILQVPMAYKGAAAQGYNYLQSGAIAGLPVIAGGAGAYLGGPMGSMAGAGLGGAASMAAKAKIDASMAQKLAESLRNPRPAFPAP
jgi:hypothetical protein